MIRKYHYFKIIILIQLGKHCTEDFFVDNFDRLNFVFYFMSVTALIWRLNVYINKILTVFKLLKSSFRFSFEICINVSRCTVNVNNVHAGKLSNTFKQIYSRYHRTLKAIAFKKLLQIRSYAFAPEPDTVCGTQTAFDSCFINRVIF